METITVKTFKTEEDRTANRRGTEIGKTSSLAAFNGIRRTVPISSGLFLGYFTESGENLFLEQAEIRLGKVRLYEPGYEEEA